MTKVLTFPKNFLWGASTSAYQIEGGNVNDWSEWEKSEARSKKLEREGKNLADYICGQACDSYNRYEEDLDMVKNLNCGAYRMSIEWSRIEPAEGEWDMKEIEHYRRVLQAAKQRNLKIVLTLWHWTNPLWLAALGGWANKQAVEYFARYAELIARELGSQVDYWITINEPMMHVLNGYLIGKWPPDKKNIFQVRKVYNNLLKAHLAGYEIIHKKFSLAQVGLTMLTNYFEPAHRWNPAEMIFAKLANHCWNDRFVKKLKHKYDFLGLDYYFHDRIIWRPWFKKNFNQQVTDMGWEIYPAGIEQVLKNYQKFNRPLFIMENGIADADDDQRAEFIVEHLKYVHRAIIGGADVRGYFHWSLLDNFEWADGWTQKFGLYSVDRKTFKRTARPSAKLYAQICKNNQVKVD